MKLQDLVEKINTMDKIDELISVHSACLNREFVPRIFIPEPTTFNNQVIQTCLTSSPGEVKQNTVIQLQSIELSDSDFSDKNDFERSVLAEQVLQRIYDGFGPGFIHYEMARFTPFTIEACESHISRFVGEIDLGLTKSIASRLKSMTGYMSKYPTFYKYSTTRPHLLDMLSLVMINKINIEWQKTWLLESRYKDFQSQDIIDGVLGDEQSC